MRERHVGSSPVTGRFVIRFCSIMVEAADWLVVRVDVLAVGVVVVIEASHSHTAIVGLPLDEDD